MSEARSAALWLLPADPRLQAAVDSLSAQHATHAFEAHLTLVSGFAVPEPSAARAALHEIAAHCEAIALEVTDAGESDEFFETAFLRCADSDALQRLREHARRVFGPAHAPAIGPHVSLVYARLPRATRRAIASSHARAIAGPLRFTRLALVQSGPDGWQPVDAWRVLCRCDLQP